VRAAARPRLCARLRASLRGHAGPPARARMRAQYRACACHRVRVRIAWWCWCRMLRGACVGKVPDDPAPCAQETGKQGSASRTGSGTSSIATIFVLRSRSSPALKVPVRLIVPPWLIVAVMPGPLGKRLENAFFLLCPRRNTVQGAPGLKRHREGRARVGGDEGGGAGGGGGGCGVAVVRGD